MIRIRNELDDLALTELAINVTEEERWARLVAIADSGRSDAKALLEIAKLTFGPTATLLLDEPR